LYDAEVSLRVEAFGDLAGWKPFAAGAAFSQEGARVGACPACGHVTDTDRPSAARPADVSREVLDSSDRLEIQFARRVSLFYK
jgi:hypothetical protein